MTVLAGRLLRFASAVALWAAPAVDALATGDILCKAADGSGASISVGVGHVPILAVLSARAFDGRRWWSTAERGKDTAMRFGQGISERGQLRVDFTDVNVTRTVVSLRLHQATVGRSSAMAGILVFADGPVVPVQCIGG